MISNILNTLYFIVILYIIIFSIKITIRLIKKIIYITRYIKIEVHHALIGLKVLVQDNLSLKSRKIDLPKRSGQVAVVTGGARGIGVEIVKMLMQCDMHVINACRNTEAGKKVEEAARKEGIKTGTVDVIELDLGSFKSIKKFSKIVVEKYPKINILINNAGVGRPGYVETEDGFESQFGVNYIGHFLLTHYLLPNIKSAGTEDNKSRIVNVSSNSHYFGVMDFEDYNTKRDFITMKAYGQSKLAQVLFTLYLARKFEKEKVPIEVFACDPGAVNTTMNKDAPIAKISPLFIRLFYRTPRQGAIQAVYPAISPELIGKSGSFIRNCNLSTVNSCAKSIELQDKTFSFTTKLVKIENFDNPILD